jgi:hypothetical protein
VDAQPTSFRPRFDDRVFSLEERSLIASDENPMARRWAHWAAKEAAYKLAKQIDSSFVFSPGRLVANYDAAEDIRPDSGMKRVTGQRERRGRLELPNTLSGELRMLNLRSVECDEWVHVVAVPVDCDWVDVETAVEPLDRSSDDPSGAVRAMAIRKISDRLDVAPERLSIGREDRIPFVEIDGVRTSHPVSLSHHGSWIGFAVRLRAVDSHSAIWTEGRTDSAGGVTRETSAP